MYDSAKTSVQVLKYRFPGSYSYYDTVAFLLGRVVFSFHGLMKIIWSERRLSAATVTLT